MKIIKFFYKGRHNPKILGVLKILLVENVMFHNSKLNIKAIQGDDWHEDWKFYLHII